MPYAYLGSDTTIETVQVQMLEEYFSLKIVEILLSVDHVRFKSIDERRVFRKLNKNIVLDLKMRWFRYRWVLGSRNQQARRENPTQSACKYTDTRFSLVPFQRTDNCIRRIGPTPSYHFCRDGESDGIGAGGGSHSDRTRKPCTRRQQKERF